MLLAVKIICTVTYPGATHMKIRSSALVRDGRTYARGGATRSAIRMQANRRLKAGRYVLVTRIQDTKGRNRTVRQAITFR